MSRLAICFVLFLTQMTFAQSTLFSVGPGGPSGLPADTIFSAPGSGMPMPIPVAGGAMMGLMPSDVIGSFSQSQDFESDFLFCFSVTPDTFGGAAPLVDFPRPGIRFNVADQADAGQQAGDAFITTEAFSLTSTLASASSPNNVLVINQSLSYVNTFGLLPMLDPDMENMGGLDDVRGGETLLSDGPVTGIYFSLERGSPSLGSLSGASPASAANVFVDATPDLVDGMAGDESLFAVAADMGLVSEDAIDALIVFGDDDGVFSSGDTILFSLDADSPTLGTFGVGPGDILSKTFDGDLEVFAGAEMLGLEPMSSNVNMLVPVPLFGLSPVQMIQLKVLPEPNSALGLCWPMLCVWLSCRKRESLRPHMAGHSSAGSNGFSMK